MRKILSLILLSGALAGFSQDLSKQNIERLRATFKKDAYTKAMQNALSSTDISTLAWNRANVGTTDHLFKYRVDVSGITNQKSSGLEKMVSIITISLFRNN